MSTVEMLERLRRRWSVYLADTSEGWSLTLSTVNEDNEIDEHRFTGVTVGVVVRRAWEWASK